MRTYLVEQNDGKEFRISIPDDAKVTFAPFSPPKNDGGYRSNSYKAVGTLRIYQGSKENIIGMFTEVASFRDLNSMNYSEKIATEEVSVVWKSDRNGYEKEEKVNRNATWIDHAELDALPAPARPKTAKRIARPKKPF